MSEWISVKERLPAGGIEEVVLTYDEFNGIHDLGTYLRRSRYWVCEIGESNPTHWMPLPEPPKESEKGEE
jgi:Protein of unknown function (DUF551)